MDMEVADAGWASLLPDLLVVIVRRVETTAVIRCAGACKPWRRAIIANASSLRRHRPDRFIPNLLRGFFHHSWNQGVVDASSPPPPRVIVSVTAVDTGHCDRLSSLIRGFDLSSPHWILSLRHGFLLLQLRRRSNHDELCLCNPMAGECRLLPQPSIMEDCEYTLLSGSDYNLSSPGTTDGSLGILAKAGTPTLCTEEDRLTYQVFSFSGNGGAGTWGPVQRSDEVKEGRRMLTYGRNTVVAHGGVYWLAGQEHDGRNNRCDVTCTVGLDISTGRAWSTELPTQCQFSHFSSTTPYALTTSGNGRLSLLQPLPAGNHIQVWVLDGDVVDAMKWTVEHKISIDVPNHLGDGLLRSHYSNVVCPGSGFLFVLLHSGLQLRINLDSRACNPVQCIGEKARDDYYPYEMDWSTYIANMKIF